MVLYSQIKWLLICYLFITIENSYVFSHLFYLVNEHSVKLTFYCCTVLWILTRIKILVTTTPVRIQNCSITAEKPPSAALMIHASTHTSLSEPRCMFSIPIEKCFLRQPVNHRWQIPPRLASFIQSNVFEIHQGVVHINNFFKLLNSTLWYGCTTICWTIHMKIYFGCFQCWVIMNRVAKTFMCRYSVTLSFHSFRVNT